MADKIDKVEALAEAELFNAVDHGVLAQIAEYAQVREYEEGETIYRLGDDAREVHALISGRVRFTLGVGNRSESSGSIMSGRMVFGWAALVADQPRRVATAECLEDSVLLSINGAALIKTLEKSPESGFLVMRRLASMIARNFVDVGSN